LYIDAEVRAMKILVVYDSAFGNTEQIAKAIGSAIGAAEEVLVERVARAGTEQLKGLEVLVVGSPTQGFRPLKAIIDFIDRLPAGALKGIKVAAFDTRIASEDIKQAALRAMVKMGGYAAKHIESALKKKGGTPVMPAEGFFVMDREGPLKEGELARAAEWAREINVVRGVK
jgi:flavodoxin